MTRITDIVDNRASDGFAAEHGLSLLIEHGDERVLFDTGAGAALRPNAAKLGIDLNGVTRIVLSHSHNDHTGGLGGLAPKCPIHVGDGFNVPCFSKHADGSVHSLAVPPDAKAVLATADVRVGRQFDEIAKGIYLSERIERTSGEDSFVVAAIDTEPPFMLSFQLFEGETSFESPVVPNGSRVASSV